MSTICLEISEKSSLSTSSAPESIARSTLFPVEGSEQGAAGAGLSRRCFAFCAAAAAGLFAAPAVIWALDAGKTPIKASEDHVLEDYACVGVVVIGAGSAGLAAAIEAKAHGAQVVVLEKMPMPGGNTLLSGDGILALAPAEEQTAQETEPSPELQRAMDADADSKTPEERSTAESFVKAVMDRGLTAHPELTQKLVDESAEAVAWLEAIGCRFASRPTHPKIPVLYTIRPGEGGTVGHEVVRALLQKMEEEKIPLFLKTSARRILVEHGRVEGVEVETKTGKRMIIAAHAVVIAAGGYAGSIDTIRSLIPEAPILVSTNSAGVAGDSIRLAQDAGAGLVDLDAMMLHPTTMPISGLAIPKSVRIAGAIFLNADGKRFVDELEPADKLSRAILAQPGGTAWLIADSKIVERNRILSSNDDLVAYNLMTYSKTDEGLARAAGLPPKETAETLQRYRRMQAKGLDEDFGRTALNSPLTTGANGLLYAFKVRPAYHSSAGGIAIDAKAEVLTPDMKVIPGLYAAGEATGGVFGRSRPDRLGITNSIVFGRTAGRSAAAYSQAADKKAAEAKPLLPTTSAMGGAAAPPVSEQSKIAPKIGEPQNSKTAKSDEPA